MRQAMGFLADRLFVYWPIAARPLDATRGYLLPVVGGPCGPHAAEPLQ
jgi:hypothetical protein